MRIERNPIQPHVPTPAKLHQGGLSTPQVAMDIVDLGLGAAYATHSLGSLSHAGGYIAGIGHAAMAVGYYSGITPGDKHSRHCKGFGHAILAAGHIAGAAGASGWVLAPLFSGVLITTLQNNRDRL